MRKHFSRVKSSRWVEPSTVNYIFERDGGMCIYCGNPAYELDHVISAADGAPTSRSNLVCVCHRCNCKKRNHFDDPVWLTRAIFWLLQQGEDIKWMDKFYNK